MRKVATTPSRRPGGKKKRALRGCQGSLAKLGPRRRWAAIG
jgi:hypothetical protein